MSTADPAIVSGHERTDPDRLLRIYLQDHYAGSAAGVRLARRCREATPELGHILQEVEAEIAQDRRALEAIMSRLGVSPSRFKSTLGASAELVGRLKTNGALLRRSPSSAVVELEGLTAGVVTKRSLWRALATIGNERAGLDPAELEQLIERATRQIERLRDAHARAAGRAFRRRPPAAQH
jgi:hypothetical protein